MWTCQILSLSHFISKNEFSKIYTKFTYQVDVHVQCAHQGLVIGVNFTCTRSGLTLAGQGPAKATQSLFSWSGERKCSKTLMGQDEDRERLREINWSYYQSNRRKVMRNKKILKLLSPHPSLPPRLNFTRDLSTWSPTVVIEVVSSYHNCLSLFFFLRMRTHHTLPLASFYGRKFSMNSPMWSFLVGCSSSWTSSTACLPEHVAENSEKTWLDIRESLRLEKTCKISWCLYIIHFCDFQAITLSTLCYADKMTLTQFCSLAPLSLVLES